MAREVAHEKLGDSDLFIDAIYLGGKQKNLSSEVLSKLFSVGNAGGFRVSIRSGEVKYAVLYSSGGDIDWPDSLDRETGLYTYYGDNKTPGQSLHDTKKGGNSYLRKWFEYLHSGDRNQIPPLFLFEKTSGRNMRYLGLAVPGAESLEQTDDLVAIWKTKDSQRFQNYRAKFTVLDIPIVSRDWINDLENGVDTSIHTPNAFNTWVNSGRYLSLRSERSTEIRKKKNQQPEIDDEDGWKMIELIHKYFPKGMEYMFELVALRLFEMIAPNNLVDHDVTRPSMDGGKDASGKYRIGIEPAYLYQEFALEAKCYEPRDGGCGVSETKRLISRLRHRQFGVFVTTSYVSIQAYSEIVEDKHPVLIIAARDIVEILRKSGHSSPERVKSWLESNWPLNHS